MEERILRPGGLALTARLTEKSGLLQGARVLDLGCGAGAAVRWLREQGFDVIGLDLFPSENAVPSLIRGDARHPPFPERSFDAVLAECSLSEIGISEGLAAAWRLLRPSGLLLLSDLAGGNAAPEARGWRAVLERTGFRVLYEEDCTQLLRTYILECLWQGRPPGLGCTRAGAVDPKTLGYLMIVAEK